jgi:ATP synthase protein I
LAAGLIYDIIQQARWEMKRWAAALRVVGVGWYIAICVALGLGIGFWLDRIADTVPLLTLIGLGLGLLLAFFGVYRMLLPALRQERDKDKGEK